MISGEVLTEIRIPKGMLVKALQLFDGDELRLITKSGYVYLFKKCTDVDSFDIKLLAL